MKTAKIESQCFVTAYEFSHVGGNLTVDSEFGRQKIAIPGRAESAVLKAIQRAINGRLRINISLEFPVAEIDEARDLLAKGESKAALTKALDILERLDK